MASEARQQAQAEKLILRVAENTTGYFGVYHRTGRPKPYQALVRRARGGCKQVNLGYFATAEEAALCVARSLEGQAVVTERAPPLTSEDARQQAQAEKLTLLVADNNSSGYFGVSLDNRPGQRKPYAASVWRGGKRVNLGCFATAEEAALCVARSPEGQAAAESQGMPSGASLKEEGTVPPLPHGTFVKEEGAVPPMPPDAFVKVEVVVNEESPP